jgi:hypothetical protein
MIGIGSVERRMLAILALTLQLVVGPVKAQLANSVVDQPYVK